MGMAVLAIGEFLRSLYVEQFASRNFSTIVGLDSSESVKADEMLSKLLGHVTNRSWWTLAGALAALAVLVVLAIKLGHQRSESAVQIGEALTDDEPNAVIPAVPFDD
jgi:hypothetical protein